MCFGWVLVLKVFVDLSNLAACKDRPHLGDTLPDTPTPTDAVPDPVKKNLFPEKCSKKPKNGHVINLDESDDEHEHGNDSDVEMEDALEEAFGDEHRSSSPEPEVDEVPDIEDAKARRPVAGQLRLSRSAINGRLRRLMKPDVHGNFKVSEAIIADFHSAKNRKNIDQIFHMCGYDPEMVVKQCFVLKGLSTVLVFQCNYLVNYPASKTFFWIWVSPFPLYPNK